MGAVFDDDVVHLFRISVDDYLDVGAIVVKRLSVGCSIVGELRVVVSDRFVNKETSIATANFEGNTIGSRRVNSDNCFRRAGAGFTAAAAGVVISVGSREA